MRVVCCCAVKDRYGDRADESDSESSESSSDDSEVVSMAASSLSTLSIHNSDNVPLCLLGCLTFYRNWTLQLKGTFTERYHC